MKHIIAAFNFNEAQLVTILMSNISSIIGLLASEKPVPLSAWIFACSIWFVVMALFNFIESFKVNDNE